MRSVFVVVAFVIFKFIYAEYSFGKEWTPIPNEEVFRRLNFNVRKPTNIQRLDPSWYQNIDLTTESPDMMRNSAIKLVEPQKMYKLTAKTLVLPSKVNNTKQEKIFTKIETSTVNSIRKAKKIDEQNYIVDPNDSFIQEQELNSTDDGGDLKFYKEETNEVNETESYEVTENSEATHPETSVAEPKSGYVYSPPNIKTNLDQNNFTNIFQKILDKYHINNKDKLTNYAKSRIPNSQIPHYPPVIYFPFPLQHPGRYNTLNHVAVDPLMAVFLSNYGHYLPYNYGIHNNYRNLYGYLASNNIHNNKPFGSYKIFSDTDLSSRK